MGGRITPGDVSRAFARIEEELIASMVRNLSRHRAEEAEAGFQWAQWQALQLEGLDAYARGNARRYGPAFDAVNAKMEDAIRGAYADGGARAEAGILEAVRRGWSPPARHGGTFFSANSRRLDALVAATRRDMMRAEHAVLRRSHDAYRKAVFDAQVYAASGAGTYEKAIDMATDDLLRSGLASVTYANGSVHRASEYAGMAVRTAVKRATFAGDGDMRREWGVHTVVVNNRSDACAECMEWCGQVLVDDVYSGGTAAEAHSAGYALLSEAMDAGLFHPNCRDTMSTWFPGVSDEPRKRPESDKRAAEEYEYLERAETVAESNSERYARLSEYSLDDDKRERYAELADEWAGRKEAASARLEGMDIELDGFVPCLLDKATGEYVETEVEKVLASSLKGFNTKTGWGVNWSQLRTDAATGNPVELFKLTVSGKDEPQGLMGLSRPSEPGAYPHGCWAVANPKSQAKRVGKEGKEYDGIGGHLFAVMCEKSKEWGYDGIIVGEAKNAGVLRHYLAPISEDGLGARWAGGLNFCIDERSAKELMELYNYEWR